MPSSNSRVLERPPLGGARRLATKLPAQPQPVIRPVQPLLTEERLAQMERDAYAAGFAAGERAGYAQGEQVAQTMLAAVSVVRDEIRRMRAALVADAERDVLHLAIALARAVLDYEVAADHPVPLAGIALARDHFAPTARLTVRIHPDDQPVLDSHRADLLALLANDFDLVTDPGMERGGAVLEGDGKLIDATLVTRFEQALATLMERL